MDPTQQPVQDPQMPQMPQMPPAPGGQPTDPNQQPVSEEQKQALLDMIAEIKNKIGSVKAMSFAATNKNELERKALLKEVFDKLQMAGVDLSDRQSVSDFMQNLNKESPELAHMFEQSMEILLGGAPKPPQADPSMDPSMMDPSNMNNTNPNENLPQG